jgi:hypothetical protein
MLWDRLGSFIVLGVRERRLERTNRAKENKKLEVEGLRLAE